MTSILEQLRSQMADPDGNVDESPQVAAPAAAQPAKAKPKATTKAKGKSMTPADEADLIASLLPDPCKLQDLTIELSISDDDLKQIADSKLERKKISPDREDFFDAKKIGKEIVRLGIEWERSRISHARDEFDFADFIEADTFLNNQNIHRQTGLSLNNVCYLLDIKHDNHHLRGQQLPGRMAVHALRAAPAAGLRPFVVGTLVGSFLRRLDEQKAESAQAEPQPITEAIERQKRLDAKAEADRIFGLQLRYGQLVKLRGKFDDDELAELAKLMLALNYDQTRYDSDVAILVEADRLAEIGTAKAIAAAEKEAAKAMDLLQQRKKEERELPQLLKDAATAQWDTGNRMQECQGAEARLIALQESHKHLFFNPSAE